MDITLGYVCRVILCAAICAGPLLAAPAEAEPGSAHGGGHAAPAHEPSLFSGDLGNAIWTLVIFVFVLAVLGRFAWRPILATLQRREEFIRESLESARRDREEAEKRLREHEERLHRAKEEATAIVEEGRRDAEDAKRRIAEQARAEADAMIQRARREIGIARDTAVKELYERAADLATEIAGKAMRRAMTEDEHRRLIVASLEELREKAAADRTE